MDLTRLTRPVEPMPDDVRTAMEDAGVLLKYTYRPAYQQNDYLRWIGRAKRLSTRIKRIQQMIEELKEGNVYMRMRHRSAATQSSAE